MFVLSTVRVIKLQCLPGRAAGHLAGQLRQQLEVVGGCDGVGCGGTLAIDSSLGWGGHIVVGGGPEVAGTVQSTTGQVPPIAVTGAEQQWGVGQLSQGSPHRSLVGMLRCQLGPGAGAAGG